MQHGEDLFSNVIESSDVLPVDGGDVVVMGARRRRGVLTGGEEGGGGSVDVVDGDDVMGHIAGEARALCSIGFSPWPFWLSSFLS